VPAISVWHQTEISGTPASHLCNLSLSLSLSLSILTATFSGKPGLASFIGAKDDGGGGDNWSYKTCKAPVKSWPSTYRHRAVYRQNAIPVTQPTVSQCSVCNRMKKCIKWVSEQWLMFPSICSALLLTWVQICWWRTIVVRTLVSAGELSLSCIRLLAGPVTTLWLSRPLSVSQHSQLSHPSLRGR